MTIWVTVQKLYGEVCNDNAGSNSSSVEVIFVRLNLPKKTKKNIVRTWAVRVSEECCKDSGSGSVVPRA